MLGRRAKTLQVSLSILIMLILSLAIAAAFPSAPVVQEVEPWAFPRVRDWTLRTIDDDYLARDEALGGRMDCVTSVILPDIRDALVDANFTISRNPGFHVCYVGINCRDYKPEDSGEYYAYHYSPGDSNYPLNVTAVRQAFHFLMDKPPILWETYKGIVEEAFSVIPPAVARWYWPGISPWPYDETRAYELLTVDAKWVFDNGIFVPKPGVPSPEYPGDYIPLRPLYFLFPSETIAPTSYAINHYFGAHWNLMLNTWAGTTDVSYIEEEPVEYTPLILVPFYNRDHDFYFLCWGLDPMIDYLYWFFHPDTDFAGWNNSPGLDYKPLNDLIWEIMYWKDVDTHEPLDEAALFEISKEAQRLLFDYTNPESLCPYLPIYHRWYTAAYDPNEIENWIESPGFGSFDEHPTMPWTFCHMNPPGVPVDGSIIWHDAGVPESIHTGEFTWAYEWLPVYKAHESGFVYHPYTHEPTPWICTDWGWEPWAHPEPPFNVEQGMVVTWYLRQDVYWQDGTPLTAEDLVWQYRFLKATPFPERFTAWEHFVYAEAVSPYVFRMYLDIHGEWYGYPGDVMFPKKVWEPYWGDVDAALAYDHWKDTAPDWSGASETWPEWWPYDFPLTNWYGTGPFLLEEWDEPGAAIYMHRNPIYWVKNPVMTAVKSDTKVDPDTDVQFSVLAQNVDKVNRTVDITVYLDEVEQFNITDVALGPFDHTWLGQYQTGSLTRGIHTIKLVHTEPGTGLTFTYEHEIIVSIPEDRDNNFVVNILDIARAAVAFGSKPGHPRWDPVADIDHNFKINILDVARIAKKFGWPTA